jgi:hypothetical protein
MATRPAHAQSGAAPTPSAPRQEPPWLPKILTGLLFCVPVLAVVLIVFLIGWNIWLHAISSFLTAVMIELGKLFGTVP